MMWALWLVLGIVCLGVFLYITIGGKLYDQPFAVGITVISIFGLGAILFSTLFADAITSNRVDRISFTCGEEPVIERGIAVD